MRGRDIDGMQHALHTTESKKFSVIKIIHSCDTAMLAETTELQVRQEENFSN